MSPIKEGELPFDVPIEQPPTQITEEVTPVEQRLTKINEENAMVVSSPLRK